MHTQLLPNGVTIATEAVIQDISFDAEMLHCKLDDERIISVPLKWYPRLYRANVEQRNNWELFDGGREIHWRDVDEDLPVRAFLAGCQNDDYGIEELQEDSFSENEIEDSVVNAPAFFQFTDREPKEYVPVGTD